MNEDLLIDVRTPKEYQEDHLPGAINLPVLTNDQRAEVGTIYNQESTFRARQIGARYICRNLPSILKTIEQRAEQDSPIVIYCWRGGQRSQSLSIVLERIGYPIYRLQGGYKSYRKRVHNYFEREQWSGPLVTIYGLTGTGKTELLHLLAEGDTSILDLEKAACHRGSAFGGVGMKEQPSQKRFESRLYRQLRDASSPIVTEGESRHIGSVRIPGPLFDELISSPRIWLEASMETRVRRIEQDYEWRDHRDDLLQHLTKLKERLGGDRVADLQQKLRDNRVQDVIRFLLEEYYDPAYQNSCPSRESFDYRLNGDDLERAGDELKSWIREHCTGVRSQSPSRS